MKKCLIIANGSLPNRKDIEYAISSGYEKIICADGGANSSYKLGIVPDFIIGDLDSIRPDIYKYYKIRSEIIHLKRQNDTDVEKAIKFAIKNKFTHIFLAAATGDRLDHTFCNLGIVIKYFKKISIRLLHYKSLLTAYSGNIRLITSPGEIISVYGIDHKTFISSKGLKYPLRNIAIPFGIKDGTSNVALSDHVDLKIRGGIIFVIRDYGTMKKNGLF